MWGWEGVKAVAFKEHSQPEGCRLLAKHHTGVLLRVQVLLGGLGGDISQQKVRWLQSTTPACLLGLGFCDPKVGVVEETNNTCISA